MYDHKLFTKLRPLWDDEEGYVTASRQSNATLEKLLAADMAAMAEAADGAGEWNTDSLYAELSVDGQDVRAG